MVIKRQLLSSGAVAIGASLVVPVFTSDRVAIINRQLTWQIMATGTASFVVALQGRLDATLDWVDLGVTSNTGAGATTFDLGGSAAAPFTDLQLVITNQDASIALSAVDVWVMIQGG